MDSTSKKSQILKLSLIVALLVIAPLLSTSLRPTYLYFLFNLLIVALGAEAGLLSFISKAAEEKKPSLSFLTAKIPLIPSNKDIPSTNAINETAVNPEECNQKMVISAVEKCSSVKIVGAVKVHVFKKCPSTPSLFFIGGGDRENETVAAEELVLPDDDHEGEESEEVLPSGQELFHKAETFIGNFYKQLKMQREDSWKKIHGLYHKAF